MENLRTFKEILGLFCKYKSLLNKVKRVRHWFVLADESSHINQSAKISDNCDEDQAENVTSRVHGLKKIIDDS
jgi:hypothetical protein